MTGGLAPARSRRRPGYGKRVALAMLLVLSLLYLLSPPAWMLLSSLSPDRELRNRPPHWVPHAPTFDHYQTLFQLAGADRKILDQNPQVRAFPRSFLNSLVIASGAVAFCLVLGSVSAYSLSRFLGRTIRRWILLGLLASRMIPVVSVLIPIYLALQAMGMLNTLRGLVVVYTGLLLPFVIWILEGFYRDFPVELEEAAAMDGCTQLGVFLRIVLPLSGNGLFAVAAFVFISTWSDFIVGLVLTTSEAAWPISVALAQALNPITEPSWGLLNSAGLVAALVPAILAFLLRKAVMRGMLSGALKG
jgi:multiple sugar transport system permease protein